MRSPAFPVPRTEVMTGLWAGQRKKLAIQFLSGRNRFLLRQIVQPGPTKPPVLQVLETLSLGVKGSGYEADHPPPSRAKIKN